MMHITSSRPYTVTDTHLCGFVNTSPDYCINVVGRLASWSSYRYTAKHASARSSLLNPRFPP